MQQENAGGHKYKHAHQGTITDPSTGIALFWLHFGNRFYIFHLGGFLLHVRHQFFILVYQWSIPVVGVFD